MSVQRIRDDAERTAGFRAIDLSAEVARSLQRLPLGEVYGVAVLECPSDAGAVLYLGSEGSDPIPLREGLTMSWPEPVAQCFVTNLASGLGGSRVRLVFATSYGADLVLGTSLTLERTTEARSMLYDPELSDPWVPERVAAEAVELGPLVPRSGWTSFDYLNPGWRYGVFGLYVQSAGSGSCDLRILAVDGTSSWILASSSTGFVSGTGHYALAASPGGDSSGSVGTTNTQARPTGPLPRRLRFQVTGVAGSWTFRAVFLPTR